MSYIISIDTGGTFTDVVVSDVNGRLFVGKALTTRERVFLGVREAIETAAKEVGTSFRTLMAEAKLVVYGTTRATNAIVTKTTAKTAFITTAGFADILLLKEGGKFNPHDFSKDYPDPYIPKRHTFEILERMNSEGAVSVQFDDVQAKAVAEKIRVAAFDAVAVCFLWSIVNPDHENRMASILQDVVPSTPYTLSHKLIPIVREYRRASATAIDASIKPLMQEHLRGLESDLRSFGFNGDLLVSTTAGGCNHVEAMIDKPIYTIGSGPAMAPVAALKFATVEELGNNVIVCDTGGTTFDVGLVRDGHVKYTRDTWLGPQYTGDLLGISAVDMRSIGAGGGSIAWIDNGGLMRVGPQSAGAEPGPACYGRGGTLPTVSDAAVVLGYFDPDFFLGGRMKLDSAAARRAVATIAETLGLSIEMTAHRILMLAGEFMMRAISDITVNEGVNPRESTIVAGGGAAGLNIMLIARELGCEKVILPSVASALSAAGMQYADIVAEEAASFVTTSDRFDFDGVNATLKGIATRLNAFRDQFDHADSRNRIEYYTEARYLSQVWELDTPLSGSSLTSEADLLQLVEAFHDVHERIFAVRDTVSPVEFVNWKGRIIIELSQPAAQSDMAIAAAEFPSSRSFRNCFFGADTGVQTAIYKPEDIRRGHVITGPAIIEERTTTLVIYPGMSAEVTKAGNYLLHCA